MNKSISVVIPNYNGEELLKTNIPYLINALETSEIKDYEIIVSDDASSDNSVSFIKNNYPQIILIENKINKGFAGNTNSGIKAAQKDLVFILNSDVQLTEKYFIPLLKYFDDDLTFGVMSKIISLTNEKIQDGAKFPDYYFANITSTKNYIVENRKTLFTFFLSGANALVDRKKLIELGYFKEIFNPYYAEDVDLGLTAWKFGYKLYYDDSTYCKHPNSETIKKESSDKVKLVSKRNKIFLHYLHLNGFELFFYLLVTTIKTFLKILFLDIVYAKAFFQFLISIKKLKEIKTYYNRNKKRNLRDIKKLILEDIKNDKIKKFWNGKI